MSDLLSRLREIQRHYPEGSEAPEWCGKAADEIEQLRAALETVRAHICNEQIAHALVPNSAIDSSNWPSLIQVVGAALGQTSEA